MAAGYLTILGRFEELMQFGVSFPKLHGFGTFAGARAHHQGLRWLKPCQFESGKMRDPGNEVESK